jgi:hypothetical protein
MAALDPTGTRVLVYHVVVNYFAPRVNLPPEKLDISRTFKGAPPQGYGQKPGAFASMCDSVTATLRQSTGRALTLPDSWRLQHQGDTISAFINAVALRLLSAKLSAAGEKALQWVMNE